MTAAQCVGAICQQSKVQAKPGQSLKTAVFGYVADNEVLLQIVGESGLVLCCEPAPAAAAALTENLVNHASWQAAAGRQVGAAQPSH